jgi:hypothetical protein
MWKRFDTAPIVAEVGLAPGELEAVDRRVIAFYAGDFAQCATVGIGTVWRAAVPPGPTRCLESKDMESTRSCLS